MNDHALIYREPTGRIVTRPTRSRFASERNRSTLVEIDGRALLQPDPREDRVQPTFTTHLLATGTYEEMLARHMIASARLRAYGLDGHVAVRRLDDPIVNPKWDTWSGRVVASMQKTRDAARPSDWARLAVTEGDRVVVRIYGNTYSGRIITIRPKSADVRFATNEDRHNGTNRVLRFPIIPKREHDRGVTTVLQMVPLTVPNGLDAARVG